MRMLTVEHKAKAGAHAPRHDPTQGRRARDHRTR